MGEVALGHRDEGNQRTLHRTIQSLAISEELKNGGGQDRLQKRYDSTVENHEDCKEDENGPDYVDVISSATYLKST